MLQPLAKTEMCLRETLIHKASGDAFERLARFYNFPKPTGYPESSWRKALIAVVLASRGTPGSTFAALRGAFSHTELDVAGCSINPATPHRLLGSFLCTHVGRYVEITLTPSGGAATTALFYVVGLDTNAGAYVDLAPIKTAKWRGANWANGPFAVNAPQNVSVKFLPFMQLEKTNCLYQLFLDTTVNANPTTYLLAGSGVDRDTVDVDMPDQGHLMDLFSADPDHHAGSQSADGPRPIYLSGNAGSLVSVASMFDPLLSAGVKMSASSYEFCPA